MAEFAGYTYRARLRASAYGEVFRAASAAGQSVLVTHAAPELVALPGFEEAFLGRGERLGMLDHRAVEPVLMVGRAPTGELVSVTSDTAGALSLEPLLGDVIEGHAPVAPGIAAAIGRSLVAAIAHAHGVGLAHGAVHPRSVRVYADGAVRLGDFAIGQALRVVLGDSGDPRVWRLLRGFVPERPTGGDDLGAADDVWAVGVLLHRLFAGRMPPGPLPVIGPLAEVIERARAERPSERYPSGVDLRDAYDNALSRSPLPRASADDVAAFAREASAPMGAVTRDNDAPRAAPPPPPFAPPPRAAADDARADDARADDARADDADDEGVREHVEMVADYDADLVASLDALDAEATAEAQGDPDTEELDDVLAQLPDDDATLEASPPPDALEAATDDVLALLDGNEPSPAAAGQVDDGWADYELQPGASDRPNRDDGDAADGSGRGIDPAALDRLVQSLGTEDPDTGEVTSVDPSFPLRDPVSDILGAASSFASDDGRRGGDVPDEQPYIPPPKLPEPEPAVGRAPTPGRGVAPPRSAAAGFSPPVAVDVDFDDGTLLVTDTPPGGGSRLWMVVALLAFAALGGVLYTQTDLFFPERRRARQEAAERAHDARQQEIDAARVRAGEIVVDSTPGEAAVWLSLGRTPTETIALPASVVHQIRVEHEGFATRDLDVAGAAWTGAGMEQTAVVRAELELARAGRQPVTPPAAPPAPASASTGRTGGGVVRIESVPPGAQAYLLVGFTPRMSLKGVQAGLGYELKLAKDGHSPAFVVVRPEDWAEERSPTELQRSISVNAQLIPLEK